MSGKYNRIKGRQGQNEIFDIFTALGHDVQATEASGAIKRETGDIVLRHNAKKFNLEIKFKKNLNNKTLESDKADSDILIMRKNNDKFKVYMDLGTLLELIKKEVPGKIAQGAGSKPSKTQSHP